MSCKNWFKLKFDLRAFFSLLALAALLVKACMTWPNLVLVLTACFVSFVSCFIIYRRPRSMLHWGVGLMILYNGNFGPVNGYLELRDPSLAAWHKYSSPFYFVPIPLDSWSEKWSKVYKFLGLEQSLSDKPMERTLSASWLIATLFISTIIPFAVISLVTIRCIRHTEEALVWRTREHPK